MKALYDRVVLGQPKKVIAALLIFFAFAAYGIPKFRLDASSDSLVLEHDDDLKYARSVSRRYGTQEFLVVTFTPKQDLLSPASLDTLKRLRRDLAAVQDVHSVTTILDVPLMRNPPVPLKDLRDNLKTLEDEGVDLELARAELRDGPVYRDLLVSPDLRSTALAVYLAEDAPHRRLVERRSALLEKEYRGTLTDEESRELEIVHDQYAVSKDRVKTRDARLIRSVRAVIDRYRTAADLFLGGVPMIANDIVAFIRNDLKVFGLGMLVFLIVMLGIIFKRKRWVFFPMICCLYSAVTMIGMLGLTGWEVTVVSSNFISLQLIFTMAITIHVIVRYREVARERPNASKRELVAAAVHDTFTPCLYAALTTVAGFCSLILCDILPVVTFGWMMSLGLLVSLGVTFLLFPAGLMLMPKAPAEKENDFGEPLTHFFSNLTERRGPLIFTLSGAILALTLWGASRLEVENSFVDYFKPNTEIYQGLRFIDRNLGGTTPLDVILKFQDDAPPAPPPGEEDEFSEFMDEGAADKDKYWYTTTKLAKINKVHDYLDGLYETGKVQSLSTLWKIGKDINLGEPLDNFMLAILFQQMPQSFKDQLIAPYASVEDNEARINVRLKDSLPELRRDKLLKKIRWDLEHELGLSPSEFRVGGLMVLYNNMLQSLYDSQIKTIGYTALALFAMFMLLFRSWKVALIALLPNLLSAGSVLGVMGLFGIPLDVMTITIVAISVGIAVDDTIHYIHRFKRELGLGRSYLQAMKACHHTIGNAMYYTSITITVGFSILGLSNFIPSILFGLLTALAMVAALAAALSLMPRMLIVFRPF